MTENQPGISAYRREIDGLRAIAVLPVIFYHFSVPGFTGGFIGVDIFFVISGFLIGGILWRELVQTGRISITKFYVRRIRRLAPAYFSMAFATLIVAFFVLLPYEFREFGKALIASTVYLSNVFFFLKAGYFDSAAEEKVLLHTWSLSVEEQFYIFLPIFLILFGRYRNFSLATLTTLFAISLAACVMVTSYSNTATFYLFPFRAWELLAGVLLAILAERRQFGFSVSAPLSWVGIGLIAASVVLIEPDARFPGFRAFWPVLGAFLLILNGRQNNLVNRALASPGPVFIGLISYSLYLWHWPVLTLSKYYRDGYSGPGEIVFWLSLSILLAWLSWRFVERPFRTNNRSRPRKVFAGVVVASASMVLAGGVLYKSDGLSARFSPEIRAHIDASADFLQDWSRCSVPDTGPFKNIEVCEFGPEGPPEILVWGDSHVRAYKEGIALAASENNVPGLLIWRAGCPPLFDIEKQESAATRQQDQDCTDANQRIRTAVRDLPGVDRLLLIGRWSYYAEGKGIGLDAHNTISLSSVPKNEAEQAEIFSDALVKSVGELGQSFSEIFILRQVPEIPNYDSRRIARELAHGTSPPSDADSDPFVQPRQDVLNRVESSQKELLSLEAADAVLILDPWNYFCDARNCYAVRENRSFYFDNNHITNRTALDLRALFQPFMTGNPGAID